MGSEALVGRRCDGRVGSDLWQSSSSRPGMGSGEFCSSAIRSFGLGLLTQSWVDAARGIPKTLQFGISRFSSSLLSNLVRKKVSMIGTHVEEAWVMRVMS